MIKRLIKEREQIACKACDFEITSDTLFTKRAFLIKKNKTITQTNGSGEEMNIFSWDPLQVVHNLSINLGFLKDCLFLY